MRGQGAGVRRAENRVMTWVGVEGETNVRRVRRWGEGKMKAPAGMRE